MAVFDGLKVLDFSWAVAGPLTTGCLAAHGATVIRVESTLRPCATRTSPPYVGGIPEIDHAAYFALYNANKLSLSLNMNHPKATEIVKKLICWADVLAENFIAGVLEKWGLGYEEVKKIKPDIIMYRCSGQGLTGPHAKLRGIGVTLVGLAGFDYLTGWPDRSPSQPYGGYTDIVAPALGTAALIAALDYRRRTGKGQLIDVSQYEASLNFLIPPMLDYYVNGRIAKREGNQDNMACPHNAYLCRDEDTWCAIAVSTDEEWGNFCRVIGKPEWCNDERFITLATRKNNEQMLDRAISAWTVQHKAKEVQTLMQKAGVPAFVVQTAEDLYEDPQLKYRNHFWHLDHRMMGQISHLGQPSMLSATPPEPRKAAPCLGEDTEYVCTNILKMSQHEFDQLLAEQLFF